MPRSFALAAAALVALTLGGATPAIAHLHGHHGGHGAESATSRRTHAKHGRGAVSRIVKAAVESCKAGSCADADPLSRPVLGHLVAASLAPKIESFKADRASGRLRDVTVNTKYGTVNGLGSAAVNQFLGIPFATQPVGNLRWKSPIEPAPWGTLNATWWGPGCLQSETVWNIYTGSDEGCLYLNIYAPAAAPPPGGFPVMFFMHGGSWVYGSGSFLLYDADTDVTFLGNSTIFVTINYRLSVFGFLAGDALKAESPDGSVGNYGFQDQRRALQFVIDTIADFGGNPNLITIFGESAGGGSTSDHLVSPRSRGMFQRAAIESGAWAPWSAQPYNISATRLPQLAAKTNCSTAPDVVACLRALDAQTLFDHSDGLTSAFLEWSPVIDGVELTDDPRVSLAAGDVAPVPILLGFNHDEGTLFNSAKTDLNASDFLAAVEAVIGPQLAPVVAAQYPLSQYSTPWWALTQMLTDSQMLCPGKNAGAQLTGPQRAGGPYPVWVYYYTHVLWIIEYIADLFKPLGCFHGSELVNVFDLSILLWGSGEPELADAFVEYWSNFAATGNPNGAKTPTWAPYTSAAVDNIAQLDTSAAGPNVTTINGLRSAICTFWGNITISPNVIWG